MTVGGDRIGRRFDGETVEIFGGGDQIGHRLLLVVSEIATVEGKPERFDRDTGTAETELPAVAGGVADDSGDAPAGLGGGEKSLCSRGWGGCRVDDHDRVGVVAARPEASLKHRLIRARRRWLGLPVGRGWRRQMFRRR